MDYAATILAKIPGASSKLDRGFKHLVQSLEAYMPAEQVEQVMRAYEFGTTAHSGQKRMSGEPFISHPLAVAQILADMHMDSQAIAAAILHDVIEDTETPIAELDEQFGNEIATLVDGVSKLDQMQFTSRAEAQAESFRKMMLSRAGPRRRRKAFAK